MLMMRLQRVGRKNNPAYRVVVVDKRTSTKSNKIVDLIGNYNPKQGTINLDADKAKKWLSEGVQASDTVHNMLVSKKVIDAKKRNALPKKSPIIDEAKLKAEAEAAAKAEADRVAAIEAEKAAAEAAALAAAAPVEEVAVETPAEVVAEAEVAPAEEAAA
jgi:small subunit ribosomal protein S16